jgi:hypothetical protein
MFGALFVAKHMQMHCLAGPHTLDKEGGGGHIWGWLVAQHIGEHEVFATPQGVCTTTGQHQDQESCAGAGRLLSTHAASDCFAGVLIAVVAQQEWGAWWHAGRCHHLRTSGYCMVWHLASSHGSLSESHCCWDASAHCLSMWVVSWQQWQAGGAPCGAPRPVGFGRCDVALVAAMPAGG